MIRNSLCLFLLTTVFGVSSQSRVDFLKEQLQGPNDSFVFVVAHRGDWRHAPENSLQAIQNCIDMGVDIVEIDVKVTKDSIFVLMHDDDLDRTTNGTGKVWEKNWSELETLRLKNGLGVWTNHRIPTLEQALHITKDKILVNLDKVNSYYFDALISYLKEKEMLDQIIIKGWMKPFSTLEKEVATSLDNILFMPIISTKEKGWSSVLQSYYQSNYRPFAHEILFENTSDADEILSEVSKAESHIWINALWPWQNAGHYDDMAVRDVDNSYGWILDRGATIVQTDRPELLLRYLRGRNLHD